MSLAVTGQTNYFISLVRDAKIRMMNQKAVIRSTSTV
jgi:Na+-transporting NADH:ubiquinone oxidoreductase subunit NqrD